MASGDCYVLWGSAGHAKVLAEVIGMHGGSVVALFDNDPDTVSCLAGVPLLHGMAEFEAWIQRQHSTARIFGAVAIGGAKGADRRELAQRMRARGLPMPCVIHPTASVSPSARFGDGCQVLAGAVVAADVSMGEVCIVNNSANVDHESRLGHGVHVAPGAILCGCVEIGDDAMIGAGAVVLPRLRVGSRAIVGAGAVVTRDVPEGAVVAGNPARNVRPPA